MMNLKSIAEEIRLGVADWEIKFNTMTDEVVSLPRNSQNRSIKQIVGHMIDSVSNNTHRLVYLQYQDSPFEFPDYASSGNNEKWITIQNYQNANWEELIQHWKYAHLHFAFVIRSINPEKLDNEWVSDNNIRTTLKEMIEDFPRHFKLHLDQIIELLSASLQ